MTEATNAQRVDSRVAVARLPSATYPELVNGENHILKALDRLGYELEWFDVERGPLGKLIQAGARVIIKPNFVTDENQGPGGMLPLVTHQSLVCATVEAALRAGASEVLVGDAPIQACDFGRLLNVTKLDTWEDALKKVEPRFKGIRDFRRTTCVMVNGVRMPSEDLQSEDRFVLFDLGPASFLEPITSEREAFRVTCYDPRLMAKKHAPGRHQYLIARDVIEADVVINLAKLKTHKKAGLTCALKNLIGINGNKEYLPHHRIGGENLGGDCYPGGNPVKRVLEYTFDRKNSTQSFTVGRLWHTLGVQIDRMLRLTGDMFGIEGSWSGNDTIWRTCLDLNRILLYGKLDATLADEPQRRIIHLVDAVIAGQGDGPLSPLPLPMGLIFAGHNAAAVDWVGAHLLGYDPQRIPIVREAFGDFQWPLTLFKQNEIMISGDLGDGRAEDVLQSREVAGDILYPLGWHDAVGHLASKANRLAQPNR